MDSLGSLRLLVKAARLGSLGAAARQVGVSTATASRIIDRLESGLGINLLVRTSRRLALTEAGNAYVASVERILQEFDDAAQYAKGFQASPKGQLRVHSRVAVGTLCLSPLLPTFLNRYPDISVNLSLSNATNPDMISNGFDIDIRTGVIQDCGLIARKLADSRRLIVASPEYLARHGAPKTPSDLVNHNCLIFRNDSSPVFWRFRCPDDSEVKIAPKGNLETDNGSVIRHGLRAGLGVGQMTYWSVANELRNSSLVQILPDYDVTVDAFHHGIYAVFLPNRQHSAKVRLFLDYLVEGFKQYAAHPAPPEVKDSLRYEPAPVAG